MKYLLKFNESKVEKDVELIENCFLEYIDSGQCTSAVGLDDYASIFEYQVFLYFNAPPLSSLSAMAKKNNSLLKKEVWEWAYEFVKEISGSVRRCESYGFECYFHFFGQYPRAINSIEGQGRYILSVCRPGFIDEDGVSSDKHRIDDALIHIQKKIEESKSTLPKLNESKLDPNLNKKDIEIIENCFLDYIDNKHCTINHGLYIVSIRFQIPRNLVAGQTNEDKSSLYKWLETFIRGLFGDVRRCESYGYMCGFHLRDLDSGQFHLWVFKRVFMEETFKTDSLSHPNKVVLSHDEMLKSISKMILSFS